MRIAGVLALCLLTFVCEGAAAQTNTYLNLNNFKWQVGTGFDYSTGRYGGTSDTDVLSIPLDLKVQMDRLRVELTVPYLRVTGPGTYAGGVVVSGSGTTTRSGLGDINATAAFLVSKDSPSLPAIELGATVKIPTAKVGLGTGKPDYTIMTNLYHSFSPRFMLFGTVGYQWLNDFGSYHLLNGIVASAGANYKADKNTSVGFSLNYRQRYYDGLGDKFSISPYVMWNFSQNWRVIGYGLVGTTKASPRAGGGLRIIFYE